VSEPTPPVPPTPRNRVPEGGTSATLIGRLRADDQDAWSRLVRLYGPLVTYWAGRWGVAGPDAEDVSQEVFRAVAAGLAGFRKDRPEDTFRGWLRGVTRNKLLRHAERAGRQPRAAGGTEANLDLHGLADPLAGPADEPDPQAESDALHRRALDLVRGEFEPKTWQAFWATAVDNRAPADVAAEMGVSSAAVRQAKSRVLRRLREELGDVLE